MPPPDDIVEAVVDAELVFRRRIEAAAAYISITVVGEICVDLHMVAGIMLGARVTNVG